MKKEEEAYSVSLEKINVLRVFGSLCVVLFHSLLYWAVLFPLEDAIEEMNRHSILKLIAHGNFAVDLFITISGFLAAWHVQPLFKSPSNSARFSVISYLWGRCKRLLVPYFATLVAIHFMLPQQQEIPERMKASYDVMFSHCQQTMPLSFVLLNNFVGFGGCGVHLWSVAVQMHLFVIFGVLVKLFAPSSSRMIASSSCVFLLGAAIRVCLSFFIGTAVPLPAFDHPNLSSRLKDRAFYFYHTLYFATPSRLCNFFAGVLLASFLQSSTYREMTASRKVRQTVHVLVTAILAAALAAYRALIVSMKYDGMEMSEWNFSNAWAAWVLHGSPMLSVVFAVVTFLTVTLDRRVKEVSWRSNIALWVQYLSKCSYGVYLIHPIIFYWNQYVMHKQITSLCVKSPLGCLFALFTAGYVGSVIAVGLISFFWDLLLSRRHRWPPNKPTWHLAQKPQQYHPKRL
ncbi:hypothetical protein M9434_006652 [Picochlorum sp. BPE23]|nr:hypothetical protein M9434_006652 [Picochlorum sp. BPE23]